MPVAYQNAFDSPFEFSKQIPGGKLSERSFEWESGGGNHRQVHHNTVITVEGAGISMCFMGERVGAVSPEWLRASLDPLYQLLLIC